MRTMTTAVLIGALGLAACNDTNLPGFNTRALSGPFVLQTVNAFALPAVVIDSANPPLRLDALSGSISVRPDNVFTAVTTFRRALGGAVSTQTVSCTGHFTAVGNVFQFTETAGAPGCSLTFTGVMSANGDTLTASVLGVPAVFSQ